MEDLASIVKSPSLARLLQDQEGIVTTSLSRLARSNSVLKKFKPRVEKVPSHPMTTYKRTWTRQEYTLVEGVDRKEGGNPESEVTTSSLSSVSQNPFMMADRAGPLSTGLKRSASVRTWKRPSKEESPHSPVDLLVKRNTVSEAPTRLFDIVKNFDLSPQQEHVLFDSSPSPACAEKAMHSVDAKQVSGKNPMHFVEEKHVSIEGLLLVESVALIEGMIEMDSSDVIDDYFDMEPDHSIVVEEIHIRPPVNEEDPVMEPKLTVIPLHIKEESTLIEPKLKVFPQLVQDNVEEDAVMLQPRLIVLPRLVQDNPIQKAIVAIEPKLVQDEHVQMRIDAIQPKLIQEELTEMETITIEKLSAIEEEDEEHVEDDMEEEEEPPMEPLSLPKFSIEMPVISIGTMFEDDSWFGSMTSCRPQSNQTKTTSSESREKTHVPKPTVKKAPIAQESPKMEKIEKSLSQMRDASSETLATAEEVPVVPPKNPSKQVSFGVAWKGELEAIHTLPDDDSDDWPEDGLLAYVVLQFTTLELTASEVGESLKVDIKQGLHVLSSPTLSMNKIKGSIPIDWGLVLPLTSQDPLSISLKISQSTSLPKMTGLKQNLFNFGENISKLLTRSRSTFDLAEPASGQSSRSQSPVQSKPSSMRSKSFTSLSTFAKKSSEQIKTWTDTKKTLKGSINVQKDMLGSISQSIQPGALTVFFGESDLGQLNYRVFILPYSSRLSRGLYPESLSQVSVGLQAIKLHRRIWKEGVLTQSGGDVQDNCKRNFKLCSDALIGYNIISGEEEVFIQLRQLEVIRYLYGIRCCSIRSEACLEGLCDHYTTHLTESEVDAGTFILEFRDGRTIAFVVEQPLDLEWIDVRNGWVDAIDESHALLNENLLPAWNVFIH